jgi:uncharacterized membrane protein YgcG
MKKFIVIVCIALGAFTAKSQTFLPMFPACSNSDPNSQEYKDYFLSKILQDNEYCSKFLEYVNDALRASGENVVIDGGKPLGRNRVKWILAQVTYRDTTIGQGVHFVNTHRSRVSNKIEFYKDYKQKKFQVGIFEFRSCRLPFLKADCFNFIELPVEENQTVPVISKRTERVDTVYVPKVEYITVPGETKVMYVNNQPAQSYQPNFSQSSSELVYVNKEEYDGGWGISLNGFGQGGASCFGCGNSSFGGGSSSFGGGGGGLSFGKGPKYSSETYLSQNQRSSSVSAPVQQGGNQNFNNNRGGGGTFDNYNGGLVNQYNSIVRNSTAGQSVTSGY